MLRSPSSAYGLHLCEKKMTAQPAAPAIPAAFNQPRRAADASDGGWLPLSVVPVLLY